MEGYIHSIETMGLVDGPGIRTVIFFQGCSLRCSYCHNPDTWEVNKGKKMSVIELVNKAKRYKSYYRDNGGVTISGGDPLMQIDFLIELAKALKEEGIHVALDTAGHGFGNYDELLKYIDLVLLDIKETDDERYFLLTKGRKKDNKKFLEALKKAGTKIWIRHVVVPNLTDKKEHLEALAKEISEIDNVDKIQLLPYHNLGESKYDKLGLEYPLKGVEQMDKDKTKEMEERVKKMTEEFRSSKAIVNS